MSKKHFIDSLKVEKPCSQDWDKMRGNDRIRFCEHCAESVTDLSSVTRKQAMRLVREANGKLCVRYVKDPASGRALFADQLIQLTRRAPSLAAGVMSASFALSTAAYAQDSTSPQPPTPPVTIEKELRPNPAEAGPDQSITNVKIEDLPVIDRQFVTMGAVAFTTSVRYQNALTIAVSNDDIDEVRDLIAKGANVNGKEESKVTPLFVAVENGNLEIARLLLDLGAKVNARDREKRTPLMLLDEDATVELVELLLQYGAEVDLTDKQGNTALIRAAETVDAPVLKRLIEADANVNKANKEGQTALMNAANGEKLENVRLLLLAGAKVNMRNEEGDSAWDLTGSDEIEDLLVSFGAEVPEPETSTTGDSPSGN